MKLPTTDRDVRIRKDSMVKKTLQKVCDAGHRSRAFTSNYLLRVIFRDSSLEKKVDGIFRGCLDVDVDHSIVERYGENGSFFAN